MVVEVNAGLVNEVPVAMELPPLLAVNQLTVPLQLLAVKVPVCPLSIVVFDTVGAAGGLHTVTTPSPLVVLSPQVLVHEAK